MAVEFHVLPDKVHLEIQQGASGTKALQIVIIWNCARWNRSYC